MGSIDPVTIREALRGIVDPCSDARGIGNDIVEMGIVDSIDLTGGAVTINLRITAPTCHMVGFFYDEIEAHLADIAGVETVTVTADSGLNWDPDLMEPAARARREAYLEQYRTA